MLRRVLLSRMLLQLVALVPVLLLVRAPVALVQAAPDPGLAATQGQPHHRHAKLSGAVGERIDR